jgi:hypothetical protein
MAQPQRDSVNASVVDAVLSIQKIKRQRGESCQFNVVIFTDSSSLHIAISPPAVRSARVWLDRSHRLDSPRSYAWSRDGHLRREGFRIHNWIAPIRICIAMFSSFFDSFRKTENASATNQEIGEATGLSDIMNQS